MWEVFIQHKSIDMILHDKGLAKVGDNLVNLAYSLAKTLVLGKLTGEKVKDSVLARAIRETSVYLHMNRRTDIGRAADAYEAVMAYLWMSGNLTMQDMIDSLSETLLIDSTTNRKEEDKLAALSFQCLLEQYIVRLPQNQKQDS
ncbi:hypothetical protein EU527_10390 [Candidatus Thorarchaeota archaeon]|nr:MAG: hypothetical protein EU527_10390 [Candidatus Thorarchaeota archaeon]